MYASVPRRMPAPVICQGAVIVIAIADAPAVGSIALASPKARDFTRQVGILRYSLLVY
jgi:hypothetical protein